MIEIYRAQRSVYMDVIKGVTIILVTVGHVIQNGGGNEFLTEQLFYENFVFRLIYSFHMPIFAIVSGWFVYSSIIKRTAIENIFNQLHSHFIPLVFWTILIKLLNQVLMLFYGEKICWNNFFLTLPYSILNYFWFLWAVFINSVILIGIYFIFKNKLQIITTVIIFIFLMIIPDGVFQNHKFLYPYFAVGFFANKFNLSTYYKNKNTSTKIFLMICFTFIFCILFENFHKENYIYVSGISVFMAPKFGIDIYRQIYLDIFRWIIGFIGCGMFMIFLEFVFPSLLKTKYLVILIQNLGKNTLSIYCLSGVFLELIISELALIFFESGIITELNYIFVTISSISIIFATYCIGKIINKSRIARKILYGL